MKTDFIPTESDQALINKAHTYCCKDESDLDALKVYCEILFNDLQGSKDTGSHKHILMSEEYHKVLRIVKIMDAEETEKVSNYQQV